MFAYFILFKKIIHFVILIKSKGIVHETVINGGKVLIPTFAVGRAQELLLILGNVFFVLLNCNPIRMSPFLGGGIYLLEEYWEKHKELQPIPIYYASLVADRSLIHFQVNFSFYPPFLKFLLLLTFIT